MATEAAHPPLPVPAPAGLGMTARPPCHPLPGGRLYHCADWVTLALDSPHRVLSSAVLRGGLGFSHRWLNLKVSGAGASESPQDTLAAVCHLHGWEADTVGMMTAADLASLRVRHAGIDGERLTVLVTAGLSNARRAGDRAEYRQLAAQPREAGTINLALVSSIALSDAALLEAALVATEAKAALLQTLGIRSPVSGGIATGTGTDAIAIFANPGPSVIRYAGKHTLFGEVVARLVIAALGDALDRRGPLIAGLDLEGDAQ